MTEVLPLKHSTTHDCEQVVLNSRVNLSSEASIQKFSFISGPMCMRPTTTAGLFTQIVMIWIHVRIELIRILSVSPAVAPADWLDPTWTSILRSILLMASLYFSFLRLTAVDVVRNKVLAAFFYNFIFGTTRPSRRALTCLCSFMSLHNPLGRHTARPRVQSVGQRCFSHIRRLHRLYDCVCHVKPG